MKRTKEKSKQDWLEADDREFCIGIIVDDKFCRWAELNWPLTMLETRAARTIVNWVYEYHRKYKKAPRKNIEKIVEDVEKYGGLVPDVLVELKTDILPYLSEQYEKDTEFNPQYLLDRMKDELYRRQLKDCKEQAEELIESNELTEAGELLGIPQPEAIKKFDEFIWNLDEMQKLDIKNPLLLMKPWLRAGQTTFIYGDYATGKSLLAIHIASLLALDDPIDYDVGRMASKEFDRMSVCRWRNGCGGFAGAFQPV